MKASFPKTPIVIAVIVVIIIMIMLYSSGTVTAASLPALPGISPAPSAMISSSTFSSSVPSWPIPTGTKTLYVSVWGAGGGGGNGGGNQCGGGGGSGSGMIRVPITGAIAGNTIAVNVGAPGKGGLRSPATAPATNGQPSNVSYLTDINGLAFSLNGFGGGAGGDRTSNNGNGGGAAGSAGSAMALTGGLAGTGGGLAGPNGSTTGPGADGKFAGYWYTGAAGGAFGQKGGAIPGFYSGGVPASNLGGGGGAGFTANGASSVSSVLLPGSGAGGCGGINGGPGSNGSCGGCVIEAWS